MFTRLLSLLKLCITSAFTIVFIFTFASFTNTKKPKWKLEWSDEFNYNGLPDSTKWQYDAGGSGWGNNELQYYTNRRLKNCHVENGRLVIECIKETFEGNDYTSARLVTLGKMDFNYGRIEIRAKLPKGRGTWPAIWMLSSKVPRVWPDDGEIDIMENVGYTPGEITGAAHVKRNTTGTAILTSSNSTIVADASDTFHIYKLLWTPEKLEWYVDDSLFHKYEKDDRPPQHWPFDGRFYLLMNIAVGGSWGGRQGVDDRIFPQKMEIDYVRVYKNKLQP